MDAIFEIQDKTGRRIRLSKERWKHIQEEHPYLHNPEELKQTLINPLKITPSKYNPENVRYYYHHIKETRKYLFVAVRYLNGEGFIITSFLRRTIE